MPTLEEFTVADLARRLDVSEAAIRSAIDRGSIIPVKREHRTLIPRYEAERFARARGKSLVLLRSQPLSGVRALRVPAVEIEPDVLDRAVAALE